MASLMSGTVLVYDAFAAPGLHSQVTLGSCSEPFAQACRTVKSKPWRVPDEHVDEAMDLVKLLWGIEPCGGWSP